MSAQLSRLIYTELRKFNNNKEFVPQQQQLANAIASAVSAYLNTQVRIVTPSGPAQIIAP